MNQPICVGNKIFVVALLFFLSLFIDSGNDLMQNGYISIAKVETLVFRDTGSKRTGVCSNGGINQNRIAVKANTKEIICTCCERRRRRRRRRRRKKYNLEDVKVLRNKKNRYASNQPVRWITRDPRLCGDVNFFYVL